MSKLHGVPTRQSSYQNQPSLEPSQAKLASRKKLLSEKIELALLHLDEERRTKDDLEKRTSGVKKRLEQLEAAAPKLTETAAQFDRFLKERSPDRKREGFIEHYSTHSSSSNAASGSSVVCNNNTNNYYRRSNSAIPKTPQQKSNNNNIPPAPTSPSEHQLAFPTSMSKQQFQSPASQSKKSSNNNNNAAGAVTPSPSVSSRSLLQLKNQPATHQFPSVSTFFSYPERDSRGFVIPKGRSTKRTNYATSYTGEKILGNCEEAENRERIKRAAIVYAQKEEEAGSISREIVASENAKHHHQHDNESHLRFAQFDKSQSGSVISEKKQHPLGVGMSKTAELPVHMMDAAGKEALVDFSIASEQYKKTKQTTMSSRRTRFYTDYTGKRIAIDPVDCPCKRGFIVTGF